MHECFVCTYACAPCAWLSFKEDREGIEHPGTEDTSGCEPHVGNQTGPLQEQKVILTIETSFPSHVSQIFKQNGMQGK